MLALGPRARPRDLAERGQLRVHLGDGQARRRRGRSVLQLAQGGITDPDLALGQLAGKVRDPGLHLTWVELTDTCRQERRLLPARPRPGHRRRRLYDALEEHGSLP